MKTMSSKRPIRGNVTQDLSSGGTRAGALGLSRCNRKFGDASIMTKEREYRAYAGTCVDLANKATNDEDKKHLLAMAEAWLGLADRVQRPLPEPDAGSLHPALRAKFGW
jgi:hypothetical protein